MEISATSFAMITEGAFRRLPSGDQHLLVKTAVAFFPDIEKRYGVNADARWKIVAEAQRLYRDRIGTPAPSKARESQPRPEAPITASECNTFLRTLPPVPIYGEPGCPFNPPGVQHG